MEGRGNIMVTGASSGVGRATVRLLAERGFFVLACVRRDDDARAVEAQNPGRVRAVMIDLRRQETIERAVDAVTETIDEEGLQALVNCAGDITVGPLEYFPRARWLEQYDVNLFGTMEVTRAVMPLIRKGSGRIITIGAVGGGVSLPFFGAIASSKIALEAANDCLRRELHPFGVHVTMVDPGGIDTPANDKMRRAVAVYLESLGAEGTHRYGRAMETFTRWADALHKRGLSPEQVAKVVLRALRARRPRARYRVGLDSWGAAVLQWLLPTRIFDAVVLFLASLPLRFGAWRNEERAPSLSEPPRTKVVAQD